MGKQQKWENNIVFFDIKDGPKNLYCTVPLSLQFHHEVGVESLLPLYIGMKIKNVEGNLYNLRFFDMQSYRVMKLSIWSVSAFPSGTLSEATDEEIKICNEKLSEFELS